MRSRTNTFARTVLLALSTLSLATLAACNTVSGLGTDIEETSDNTKKALGGKPDPAPGQTKPGDTQK